MIQLRLLRWGDYPFGPNITTKDLKEGGQRVSVREDMYDNGNRRWSDGVPQTTEMDSPVEPPGKRKHKKLSLPAS